MKKLHVVIVLCIIATINAAYLTLQAYQQLSWPSFCDISDTLSCSSVFNHTASQIFGIPFPAIALVVYPVLLIVALLWTMGRIRNHWTILRRMSLWGMMFNGYIIYQEAFVIKAFCPLCLLCTGIIVTIHLLTYGNSVNNFKEIVEA